MKLLIAIPALNEEASIGSVLDQVKENLPEATPVVIDDGSTDRTVEICKEMQVTVISLPFNVGVGGALRVAFKYAKKYKFTHVMQIDADGQHLPSEAKKLIMSCGDDAITIGSRFASQESKYSVNGTRRIAMILLAVITSKMCRTKLTDVTSGFRISSGRAIDVFAREYPREYLSDTVESLLIANHHGIKIGEVPVSMKARELGSPSQNFIKSFWYLIRTLLIITLAVFKKSEK